MQLKGRKMNPKDVDVLVLLVNLYLAKGDLDRASRRLDEIFNIEPKNKTAQRLRGRLQELQR